MCYSPCRGGVRCIILSVYTYAVPSLQTNGDKTIERYLASGNIIDRERCGRPKLLGRDHFIVIDNCIDKNDELTTPRLKEMLLERFPDLIASKRTVARARMELGEYIRHPNIAKSYPKSTRVLD